METSLNITMKYLLTQILPIFQSLQKVCRNMKIDHKKRKNFSHPIHKAVFLHQFKKGIQNIFSGQLVTNPIKWM